MSSLPLSLFSRIATSQATPPTHRGRGSLCFFVPRLFHLRDFLFFPSLLFVSFLHDAVFSCSTTMTPPSRLPHRENTIVSLTLKSLALHSEAHPALNRVCRWPAEQSDSYAIGHSRSCSSCMGTVRRKMAVLDLRHVGDLAGFRASSSPGGGDLPPPLPLEPPQSGSRLLDMAALTCTRWRFVELDKTLRAFCFDVVISGWW